VHATFGGEGLVLLSNQDLASYPTRGTGTRLRGRGWLGWARDLRSTRQGVLESYSAMKVARWVREGTVGKGLSSGNHLAY